MVKKILFIFFLISFLQIALFEYPLHAQDLKCFPGAMHVQSNFGDGRFSISRLVEKAKEKNLKVLIITDTVLRRWEYGIWPFRNIIKKKLEENSVIKTGIGKYLGTIKRLQRENPEIVILSGVEVAPLYFWTGSILKGDLTLNDWHKQLLVIGLDTKEDYRNLPIVGNRRFLPRDWRDIIQILWPVLLLFFGIRLRIQAKSIYEASFVSRKNIAFLLIGLAILFLLNNISFSISKYSQYNSNAGIGPYQDLIDFVNKNNGLVFWAHPEASYSRKFKNISVVTLPYKFNLWEARDYTGFAAIYQDNITATDPGDLWDELLESYCQGLRKYPVWGIGDIDYDGYNQEDMDLIQTVFLLKDLTKDNVLDALRNGQMYAKTNRKKNHFILTKFVISDFMLN
jgi:hypothetical protein